MNEFCFIYDDTFFSLLTLIHYLHKKKIKPANIKNSSYTPNLLEKSIHLKLDNEKNRIKEIKQQTKKYYKYMYYVFLSNEENKELIIYYFYLNCLKFPDKVLFLRKLKCVEKTLKITQCVNHECHKYKGFTRFKELENHVLYAKIAPTNNILFLLSNHFKQRLKNEYWIIKDEKRKIFSIYNKKEFILLDESEFAINKIIMSKNELEIEKLWKVFYKTIGIKERENSRCRMNFMPKKYWKYMIEMESEL